MLSISDLPTTQPGDRFSLEMPSEATVAHMASVMLGIMAPSNWSMDSPCFRHMMPVSGLPGSCRVILDRPHPQSVPLPEHMTPPEMAYELIGEFSLQARFPTEPASADAGTFSKCFEVRRVLFGGHPAVMVLAGWMPQNIRHMA